MQVASFRARIDALATRLWNSDLRTYVPYAAVGTVTCIVAILVAEIFVQAMQPPPVETDPNDPLAIALLIDTSSSMSGEPIAEVRDASIRFLETWDRSRTHIAVIPFNVDAFIVEPILTMDQSVSPLIPKLQRLETAGGTAMQLGLQQAQTAFERMGSSRNAVMLFTDGMPSRPGLTQRLAAEMRGQGIVIVAIGSTGANYGYLEQLTGHSDNVFTTRLGDFASAFNWLHRSLLQARSALRRLPRASRSYSWSRYSWQPQCWQPKTCGACAATGGGTCGGCPLPAELQATWAAWWVSMSFALGLLPGDWWGCRAVLHWD